VDSVELLASEVPVSFVRCLALALGATWGSFFNVAIYRWPREMSVVRPPSHCPACGAPVKWYLNVPILGYVFLRGKAACCGAPMSPRYVWVEALTAVLGLAVAERYFVNAAPGSGAQHALLDSCLYFAFVGGLLVATFVDLEWMEIPDEVSLPGAALGLATVGLRTGPTPTSAAVGAGLGFLVVYVLFVVVYELLRGRRGMGEGDAKLLLMIGAFLGWEAVLFCLAAGSAQGLVVAGLAKVLGIPLVPIRPDEAGLEPEPELGADSVACADPRDGDPGGTAHGTGTAPDSAADLDPPGPAMMVFGPMLALAALEFLFFGERLLAWAGAR
jgi:leader peptidase (prepilin peptidase)/N-methyltransferase